MDPALALLHKKAKFPKAGDTFTSHLLARSAISTSSLKAFNKKYKANKVGKKDDVYCWYYRDGIGNGCNARFIVKERDDGVWVVQGVDGGTREEHVQHAIESEEDKKVGKEKRKQEKDDREEEKKKKKKLEKRGGAKKARGKSVFLNIPS